MMVTAEERKVVIVTGAASGIGAAVAHQLEARGWTVAGFDLRPSPHCSFDLSLDMSDSESVRDAVTRVQSELGPIASSVSAAGYYEMLPISEISGEKWSRMLAVHVGGFANLSRAVLPGMISAGSGSIVAIASELAIGGGSNDAHYAAAKGALLGLMKSLAAEFAPQGIRVNAVAPGPTDTPLLAADSPWRAPEYLSTLPLGRLTSPEEVALCVAFLLDSATFCVGETLNPNAGAVI